MRRPDRVSLCYSTSQAAVELALEMRKHIVYDRALRQSSPNSLARLCYSASHKGLNGKPCREMVLK